MLPPNFLQGKFKCKNLCLGSKRSKMLLLAILIMQVKTIEYYRIRASERA